MSLQVMSFGLTILGVVLAIAAMINEPLRILFFVLSVAAFAAAYYLKIIKAQREINKYRAPEIDKAFAPKR